MPVETFTDERFEHSISRTITTNTFYGIGIFIGSTLIDFGQPGSVWPQCKVDPLIAGEVFTCGERWVRQRSRAVDHGFIASDGRVRLPSMDGKVALVSLADMLNHRSEVETFLDYDKASQGIVFTTDRPYQPGEQVIKSEKKIQDDQKMQGGGGRGRSDGAS
ncbi:hypothetical protein QJS10_CPA09g01484 [Acorus calamus]|uniref:Uncharacterized protein n=1 Tax=Acorus calamus TaxID=4465 RepID=A0AAV9E7X9_ACOCL|nr:hypothetical protein QJS10_CPA09g01484 [Acorus calamus]